MMVVVAVAVVVALAVVAAVIVLAVVVVVSTTMVSSAADHSGTSMTAFSTSGGAMVVGQTTNNVSTCQRGKYCQYG